MLFFIERFKLFTAAWTLFVVLYPNVSAMRMQICIACFTFLDIFILLADIPKANYAIF